MTVRTLYEQLRQAIQLATHGKLNEAQAILQEIDDPLAGQFRAFLVRQQRRDDKRASAMDRIRHDLGNALSIAQASVEAMIDGVVEITDPRLKRVRDILSEVSASMTELTTDGAHENSRHGDPLASEVTAVESLARTKGIALAYEPGAEEQSLSRSGATTRALRGALLTAIRYAPSGSTVRIRCVSDRELTLSLDSTVAANVLKAFGDRAQVAGANGSETILLVLL